MNRHTYRCPQYPSVSTHPPFPYYCSSAPGADVCLPEAPGFPESPGQPQQGRVLQPGGCPRGLLLLTAHVRYHKGFSCVRQAGSMAPCPSLLFTRTRSGRRLSQLQLLLQSWYRKT